MVCRFLRAAAFFFFPLVLVLVFAFALAFAFASVLPSLFSASTSGRNA